MIRVRGLITSIKSNLLTSRNAFPHKVEDSWDKEFSLTNPKLNYLERLLQTNEIRPYFIEKDIKELEKQDIYFYMSNKEKFHELPRQKKQELIKNENANCILKFHLALELNTLTNEQVRKHLLKSFNTSIKSLSPSDALFCLELICSFKDVKEEINYYEVERKFVKEDDPILFLRCVYLLSQLEFKLEMMSNQLIQEKISMVENYELETILQIKHFAKFYQIEVTPFCENRLRSSFMEKRKNFKEDEAQFVVELLYFYPESANLLKMQSMNAESYISYLEFFMSSEEQSDPKVNIPRPIEHPIPHNIVTSADIFELYRIIKRRISLELDSPDFLMNNIKSYFTPNLNYVTAITRYLEKEDKMTPQNESLLEKAIINKIIKLGDKVFDEFSIVNVFKILGCMSVNELGTINFWKKTLKFVTDAIEDPKNYKNLSSNEQKKFVVYLFQIFKNKPFPRELEDQIINLTLLSLTINTWTLKEILPLTISLKVNKIGDNELWFGIEQRLKKIQLKHLESAEDRRTLKKIVHNFNLISKGSYEFWSEINKNLSKKQKTQILNSFKIPSTFAHTYLKV